MTWCVTETHHLSVIQVFELQGCNAARLVWRDLFQIAGAGEVSGRRRGRFLKKKRSTLVDVGKCVEGVYGEICIKMSLFLEQCCQESLLGDNSEGKFGVYFA